MVPRYTASRPHAPGKELNSLKIGGGQSCVTLAGRFLTAFQQQIRVCIDVLVINETVADEDVKGNVGIREMKAIGYHSEKIELA